MADPWAKLWRDWYETTSHDGLSCEALHLGPYLMTLTKRSAEEPWLLSPEGRVLSPNWVAAGARVSGRDPDAMAKALLEIAHCHDSVTLPELRAKAALALVAGDPTKRVCSMLEELKSAGTLVQRERDQAYGFTEDGWWKYQYSADALRKRRERERKSQFGHALSEDQISDHQNASSSPRARESSPLQALASVVVFAWAKMAPCLPRTDSIDIDLFRIAVEADAKRNDRAWWEAMATKANASSFLRAKKKGGPATLAWFVESSDRLVRLERGDYDDSAPKKHAKNPKTEQKKTVYTNSPQVEEMQRRGREAAKKVS